MGFFDKLKKTILGSFFGKPESSRSLKVFSRRRKKPAKVNSRVKNFPVKKKISGKSYRASRSSSKAARLKADQPIKSSNKNLSNKRLLPKPKRLSHRVLDIAPQKLPKRGIQSRKDNPLLAGVVTHFFPQAKAAAIKIEASMLSVGDLIQFKGVTTNFKIKIVSMQINRVSVTQAMKGSEIGILVKKRVREGDQVFKL